MKNSRTAHWFRHFTAAALGSLLLVAAQHGSAQAPGTHLKIRLSGPNSETSTLVYLPGSGWRLHEGWDSADPGTGTEISMKAAMANQVAVPSGEQAMLERPLTV